MALIQSAQREEMIETDALTSILISASYAIKQVGLPPLPPSPNFWNATDAGLTDLDRGAADKLWAERDFGLSAEALQSI